LDHTNENSHSNGDPNLPTSQAGLGLSPATWAAAGALGKWIGTQAAGGIVGAAAGKLFSAVMDAIGLGGPDLVGKLDKISDQLVEVQRSLDRLTEMTTEILKQLADLKRFMEESLEVTTLRTAMRRIGVAYEGTSAPQALLSEDSAAAISLTDLLEKLPRIAGITKEQLQAYAKGFAVYVQDMPTQIDTICDVVAVSAMGQDSLLTHWATGLAQRVNAKKIDREAAYLVLEGYFLQAVSVQLKGVSIHCVALGTDTSLGPQLIRNYLGDTFAKQMAKQTSAFVEAVELLLCLTLAPTMPTSLQNGLGEREFPRIVDELLLRADLIAAALNLVGHKPDSAGKLSPSIQAAIQGIYGRALLRPSDLNNGKPPSIAPTGYSPATGTAVRKLAFACLDLVESGGRAVLSDAASSAATVAHYFWPFPSPEPTAGKEIDGSLRGGVTPARYPVFGSDEPSVLAASVFDVSRLYRGLQTGAQKSYNFSKFPGGNNDLGYYNEQCNPHHHALTNDRGDSFDTFFNVVHIYRLNTVQHSYVVHPLFTYSGGAAKVRVTAHIASIVSREPRKDGQGGTAFAQRYEVLSHLKLRRKNGWEKEFYNSVLSFGSERPLSLNEGGGGWHDFYKPWSARLDGFFSVDFDLEAGDYELLLDNEVNFAESPKRYEGWQSSSLAFYLHGLSIERV